MFDEFCNNSKIYETDNFIAFVPNKPHVSREDGGHIVIGSTKKKYASRLDFSPSEAKEVMRITMIVSEAMINGMKKRGINIEKINYQENGNWSYLNEKEPKFHIHLYGRTKNSEIQPWGEALNFPNPTSGFFDNFIPFNEKDIEEIRNEICFLEKNNKYDIKNWL